MAGDREGREAPGGDLVKPLTVACVSADQWGTSYYRSALVKRGLERRPDLGINFVRTHLFGAGLAAAADVLYILVNPRLREQ